MEKEEEEEVVTWSISLLRWSRKKLMRRHHDHDHLNMHEAWRAGLGWGRLVA